MTTLEAYAQFLTARWDEMEAGAGDAHLTGDDDAPRSVLADLAAKRAILDECADWDVDLDDVGRLAAFTLRHLAEPFRDHPDHPANQERE